MPFLFGRVPVPGFLTPLVRWFGALFLFLSFLTYLLVPVVRWFGVLFLYCVLVPVPVSAGSLVHLGSRDAAAAVVLALAVSSS